MNASPFPHPSLGASLSRPGNDSPIATVNARSVTATRPARAVYRLHCGGTTESFVPPLQFIVRCRG